MTRGLYVDPHAGRVLFTDHAAGWMASRNVEATTDRATGHQPNDTAAVSARMAAADRDRARHEQQLAQTRRSRLSRRL